MEELIEKALIERNINGDRLLDALDLADDIIGVGGIVLDNGYARLYHATTKECAKAIISEQSMFGKEDGIFLSTKNNGQILGYGDCIIQADIPLELLVLDDEFTDELHLKIKVIPYKKIKLNLSYIQIL